ncbi:hypothetical protein QQ73_06420, partial [Candidatus Endoriftia persephone str. Guaymas]|nr:hypothetical protein [Candidatus Endoriftia persephone str. Guaymas]
KNAAEATIWKLPVEEGLSADEVEETMKFVANEYNMSHVGELPLSKDIEAKSGNQANQCQQIFYNPHTSLLFGKQRRFCERLIIMLRLVIDKRLMPMPADAADRGLL